MPWRSAALLVLLTPSLAGCVSPALVRALAKDPSTVCAVYVGIYGNLQISRTALPSGKVTCSKDGLTVESGGK